MVFWATGSLAFTVSAVRMYPRIIITGTIWYGPGKQARETFQKRFECSSVLELGRQAAYRAFAKTQNCERGKLNGSRLWNEPA